MTLADTTVAQLRDLADGDSFAAFKSAALAVGMTEAEADLVWQVCDEAVESDVRDCGMELRAGDGQWMTSSASVDVEDWR